ncbi:MAG: RNA methyltransferase [Candidatus Riflebacteria bacterium]|nr:RNA methyltransferase [Candidatus Riflebacteria bacterium]
MTTSISSPTSPPPPDSTSSSSPEAIEVKSSSKAKSPAKPPLIRNIRIILVEPQGPMNVGSVCRAMKNFGLRDLVLLRPACKLNMEAEKMALHAKDILQSARIVNDLQEAIAGSVLVLGTSNRRGEYHEPNYTIREGVERIAPALPGGVISILFGREEWGLTIEELKHCQGTIRVQTDPAFSSMNLSQAVLLVAYELWNAFGNPRPLNNPHEGDPYEAFPTTDELSIFYRHMKSVMERCHFLPRLNADALFQVIRAFISRAAAKRREINILMGVFSNLDGFMKKYVLTDEEKAAIKDPVSPHWKKVELSKPEKKTL